MPDKAWRGQYSARVYLRRMVATFSAVAPTRVRQLRGVALSSRSNFLSEVSVGRKSKLTDKQWEAIGKRLLKGEKPASLAKEYGVDRAAITRKFAQHVNTVKTVANQIVATEEKFRELPVAQQIEVISLADELRAISMHLAGAAKHGAMTAHRLSGIANQQVSKIDDAEPLSGQSIEVLKGVAALTKLANDSSVIGINLLAANKEFIKDSNSGGNQSKGDFMRELVEHLPN